MDLRGQRFRVHLSDDEDETGSSSALPSNSSPFISSAFIGDIKERSTAPPSAPNLKTTPTGFPEHKKRTRISTFKQQRGGSAKPADSHNAFALPSNVATLSANANTLTQQDPSIDESERQQIDEENKRRLASMSEDEINEERREILTALNPSLIERLLKRPNLDAGRGDTGTEEPSAVIEERKKAPEATKKEEEEAVSAPRPAGKLVAIPKGVRFEDDNEPAEPIDLQPVSNPSTRANLQITQPSMHFPTPPSPPDLDPSDPSFLENLHTKYFPTLPADPSKLAWMAPIPTHGSVADQESPYYPANEALPASALRFDFRGGILPPRISRAMPSTKGLHHHGEAPEAAGYTVPELARLSRSAFPAQRCIAFQTLGRLLYRLGRGEWGDEDSEITKGLWRSVEEGKIIQTLEEAASAEGGHQGSKIYAVEAVWLWQKGGGKVWKAS